MSDDDYKEDLEVSFDNLPENWRDHPRRFAVWGEKHANAIAERDRAKESLEVTKAELGTEIRKDWAALGYDKAPTVDAVKDWVILQPKFKDANKKYINACEEANILSIARSAFEHRRKQLESLTQFLLMGIISANPKLQGDDEPHGDEVVQGMSKSTEKTMKDKIKPKRKRRRR